MEEQKEEKEQSKKLDVGEKYINVSILSGQIKLALFPNKDKKKVSDPDYLGNGCCAWINKKGDKTPQQA